MIDEGIEFENMSVFRYKENAAPLYKPKTIAKITICGAISFEIVEGCDFIKPTKEQIENLHDMLCMDVELYEE